jgi:hypothetical protein
MNSEQGRPVGKISYEKPTAVDLGPTAPIVGASCASGKDVAGGPCYEFGNSAAEDCSTGNTAGLDCYVGNSAIDFCSDGQGFLPDDS